MRINLQCPLQQGYCLRGSSLPEQIRCPVQQSECAFAIRRGIWVLVSPLLQCHVSAVGGPIRGVKLFEVVIIGVDEIWQGLAVPGLLEEIRAVH